MSNLKINTINSHSVARHQNLNKNFKSDDSDNRRYTDDELLQFASFGPDKKLRAVAKNVLKTFLIAVPVLDTSLRALSKKGSLASKLKAGAGASAFWTMAFATAMFVSKVKKSVNSHSKLLDDFDKEHPVASTLVNFAAVYGAFYGALKGLDKAGAYIKQTFPNKVNSVKNSVINPIKTTLNKSLINKKLVLPFENYLEKNPIASTSIKTVAFFAVPTVVLASLLRFANESKRRNENVENNYYILKAMNNDYQKSVDFDGKV